MSFFYFIFDLVFDLLYKPFTLYGFTFSFFNVIILVLVAGLVSVLFGTIFKF